MPSYKITFSFEILYIPDYLALCILQSFIHMFFKCALLSRNLKGSFNTCTHQRHLSKTLLQISFANHAPKR